MPNYEDYGIADGDPHFNLREANAAYSVIMKMDDDEAWAFSSMLLLDHYPLFVRANAEEIQTAIDTSVSKRLEEFKAAAARQIVSKSRAGEDITAISNAIEVISKDFYDTWERSLNARNQQRSTDGRFRRYKATINYDNGAKPLPSKQAKVLGIKSPKENKIKAGSDTAMYQQGFLQIKNLLEQAKYAGESGVVQIQDARGNINLHDIDSTLDTLEDYYTKGKARPVTATVIVNPDVNLAGASYNLLGDQATNTIGGVNAGLLQPDSNKKTFEQKWNKYDKDDKYNPANRTYRRIGAASELADTVTGAAGINDPKVKMALAAGKWVGESGSSAQMVLGPTADKAAYRYRGTERTPDNRLQEFINQARIKEQRLKGTPDRARSFLIHGTSSGVMDPGSDKRSPEYRLGNKAYTESPLIEYFQGRVPSRELVHLQRKSGTITPSEGVIIDRQGKITTQAVGYGEDHYLPFNLKNLKGLRGGEYLRTRSMGGPTTEDVYTGLMSGARAATIVSNSGVFTIEFDPAFRGSRRYSDKAARMISRYGYLLDAVESGDVTLADIDPSRKKELEAKADEFAGGDETIAESQFQKLLTRERKNPQLSQQMKDEVASEILQEKASKVRFSDTDEGTIEDLLANYVDQKSSGNEDLRSIYARDVATPLGAVAALGLQEEFDRAAETRLEEYKRTLRPLQLNGQGYAYALSALQEQFPYYITNVSFRNLDTGTDYGYVKPRFNRPAGVLAGYYDQSIAGPGEGKIKLKTKSGEERGTGKTAADKTRYQNRYGFYANEGAAERTTDDGVASTKGADTKTPGSPSGDAEKRSRVISIPPQPSEAKKGILNLRNSVDTISVDGQSDLVDLKAGGQFKKELRDNYPGLFGTSDSDIRDAFETPNDADSSKVIERVLKDVKRIQDDNGYVSFSGVRGKISGWDDNRALQITGQTKLRAVDFNSSDWLDGVAGNMNAWYDLGEQFEPGRELRSIRETMLGSGPFQQIALDLGQDQLKIDSEEDRRRLRNSAQTRLAGYIKQYQNDTEYRRRSQNNLPTTGLQTPGDMDADQQRARILNLMRFRQGLRALDMAEQKLKNQTAVETVQQTVKETQQF